MKENIKSFILFIILIFGTIFLSSCSSSNNNSIGEYGFLKSTYSGDSIECIAYIDNDVSDGRYIKKFYTKFGYVDLYEYVLLNDDNESEKFALGNDYHSLGFTHETNFIFIRCRDATDDDFNNISQIPNLLDNYYVYLSNGEYTLHYSERSCTSKENAIYISNFSESSLLGAGFCDKCFPEMYYEEY